MVVAMAYVTVRNSASFFCFFFVDLSHCHQGVHMRQGTTLFMWIHTCYLRANDTINACDTTFDGISWFFCKFVVSLDSLCGSLVACGTVTSRGLSWPILEAIAGTDLHQVQSHYQVNEYKGWQNPGICSIWFACPPKDLLTSMLCTDIQIHNPLFFSFFFPFHS